MPPPPFIFAALFLALLAAFLFFSSLTVPLPDSPPPPPPLPVGENGTPEEEDGGWGFSTPALPYPPPLLALPKPAPTGQIVPVSPKRPLLPAAPAEEILSKLEGDKHGRFVLALSDGTVYFMNKSTGSQWKLLMGDPLLLSWRDSSAENDSEYYVYSHEDGNLYEHIKDSGIRQHNLSIEDYVDQTPIIKKSILTIGKKESVFYVVRADTGELVYMGNSPFTWKNVGMPTSEIQPVPSKLESSDTNYITIVRTDYSLLSTDVSKSKNLWSVKVSRINAYDVGLGQPPISYETQIPSISDPYIPVYILGETSKSSQQVPMLSVLPPLPTPTMSHQNEQDSVCAISEYPKSYSIESATTTGSKTDQRRKMLVNQFGHICRSGVFSDPTDKFLLDNCINKDPNLTALPTGSTGSECRPDSLMSLPYYKTNSVNPLLKLSGYTDNNSEQNNDHVRQYSKFLPSFLFGAFSFLLFLVMLIKVLYQRFRHQSIVNKQSNDVKDSQSSVSKKKKTRKAGSTRNSAVNANLGKRTVLEKESSHHDASNQSKINGIYSLDAFLEGIDANDGRWVGKLFVLNSVIGRGSNGTVVFEGIHDGRSVAVKRLLRAHNDVALKEIENLIASDQHPNIVRWHGVEQDVDFVYISLERCICSLSDLIQRCSDSSLDPSTPFEMSNFLAEHNVHADSLKDFGNEVILWSGKGLPSSQLLKLMRDIVSGLAHLHELGIIHRDLKPQNVLISKDRRLNAKLSDMGISKRLLDDMSCLSRNATGSGSSGWQAPEQLLHGRQSRAVDLFSLGCILFFCITKGKHPFGNHYDRDSNIVNNRMDLFLVDHIPEAEHLISKLLDPDPRMRPSAIETLHHPLFWSSEMRLSFLRDASDRVELEDRENGSELLKALEHTAPNAFGGKWGEKLDYALISDIGRYRKYKFESMRDLLRVIRNKLSHYQELPKDLQEILGPVPEGFDSYFASRFPKLLIEVYKVICRHCREEDSFSKYFKDICSNLY